MQIKLGSTTLADDANNRAHSTRASGAGSTDAISWAWGGPEIDSSEVAFAVQTSRPIGAANATHHGRRNADALLHFSASTICCTTSGGAESPSLALARTALILWPRDLPESGTLKFDGIELGEGKVKSVRMRRVGVTVSAEYEIAYSPGRS